MACGKGVRLGKGTSVGGRAARPVEYLVLNGPDILGYIVLSRLEIITEAPTSRMA
jgi:hypothetical protein